MSILQPESPGPRAESSGTLFGVALAAFAAYWVITPALYQLITGRSIVPATQPTSQPLPQIDPRDLVSLSIAAPIVGFVALVAGNLLWIKRPFEKAGLTPNRLRQGGWSIGLIAAVVVVPVMAGVNLASEKFWNLIHYAHPSEHDLLRALAPSQAG